MSQTRIDTAIGARLSTLDRFLPGWIAIAMVAGLLLGRLVPGLGRVVSAVEIDGISLPIAIGLLVMMYPVLAKVRYDQLDSVTGDRKLMVASVVLNWLIGPAVMFALAWLMLPDLPEYRTGLIIVGLARCIAMVIIWNDLACGDREAAAVLVALNSIFQVVMFAALGWFYLSVLPGWLGLSTTGIDVSARQIAKSVLVFLGIPLLAGYLSRRLGELARGRSWYEGRFLPRIGPWALYGLLFTIVILFALQGHQITSRPWDVARIALPLLVYFAIMWAGGYGLGILLRLGYARTTTLAFTAAGNNFELAIAVAITTYGAASGQALAGVVGPLIEVPILVALVYVSLALRPRLFGELQVSPGKEVNMSRVQLALNVDNLDEAIAFYAKLFNVEPAKIKPGYANFAVDEPPLKLVLLENPGHGGTLNHLGVEVASSDTVHNESRRLAGVGLLTDEQINETCCFATQDKVWVSGPGGERWEIYTVKAHSETFGPGDQSESTCCAS